MELVLFSVILFIITLLVWLYHSYLNHARSTQLPLPPGPKGMHSLRPLLRAVLSGTLHLEAEKWAKQYGDVVMCRTPGRKLVFLNSSRAIREAFAEKGREHVTNDRPRTFSGWFTMFNYSDVILGSPSSPDWSRLRKLFHSCIRFYGDGVERFESTVRVELRRLIERVMIQAPMTSRHAPSQSQSQRGGEEKGRGGEGAGRGGVLEWEVDMSELVSYSLLCVLGVLLTGECPEPDSDLVRRIQKFDHDVNTLFNPTTDGMLTAFPCLRHLPGYYRDVCGDVKQSRQELLETLFTKAKTTLRPGDPRGIVDVLLEEQQKTGNDWLTDTHIQCVIMDTVITAYLTSREALLDLFLYLLHHPDVMRKIQEEINHTVGERMPKIEDRSSLPFTEAVILETLRHSSFIPLGVPHECRNDVTVNNFSVPKGSMMFANTWVCHRDPEAFVDPEHFRPERFLDDAGHVISATHPMRQNLLSFGAGKRSCPGENFARTRVFLYVTTLLQKFDLLPPINHPLLPLHRDSWDSGAMLHLKPYRCVLRVRSS